MSPHLPEDVGAHPAREPTKVRLVLRVLQDMDRRAQLDDKLAIGELILREFFEGDQNTWHERRRKTHSIRRLAEQEGCPLGKSALYNAVAVYVAVLSMPWVRTCEHVKASHVQATLRLLPAEREYLLRHAEQERWSVRRLEEEVVQRRWLLGERRGRPPYDGSKRVLTLLRKFLGQLRPLIGVIAGAQVDSSTRQELKELTRELLDSGADLEAALTEPGPVHTSGIQMCPGLAATRAPVHTSGIHHDVPSNGSTK